MRVIAGEARGRPLKGPPKGPRGSGTRPTSDKVKGAIFSMLEAILVAAVAAKASDVGSPGVERAAEPPLQGGDAPDLDQPSDDRGAEDDQGTAEAVDEAASPGIWAGRCVVDLYAGTGALGIEALSRGASRADFVDSSPACQRLIRENLRATGLAARGQAYEATLPAALQRGVFRGTYDVALLDPPYGDSSLERTLLALDEVGVLAPSALVVVEHSRRGALADAYGRLRLIRRRRHGDTEISIYQREA